MELNLREEFYENIRKAEKEIDSLGGDLGELNGSIIDLNGEPRMLKIHIHLPNGLDCFNVYPGMVFNRGAGCIIFFCHKEERLIEHHGPYTLSAYFEDLDTSGKLKKIFQKLKEDIQDWIDHCKKYKKSIFDD